MALLYVARAVLIPLALAVLLSFLLTPLVMRLQRWGLGRIPAVLAVTALSASLVLGLGYVIAVEAISLADSLPTYRDNIKEKVQAITAPGTISRATEQIRETTEEVIKATTQPDEEATQPAAPGEPVSMAEEEEQEPEPMQVEVVEPEPNPLQTLASTFSPLLRPVGTAGIIIVFVIFMLIQREDLRDRVIALSGTDQISVTTSALDDAARRVSRYLLMLFFVNASYGLAAAVGLMLIGVPNALLWGVLCAVLRYIPYIGPWLGAAGPVFLSLAVFDGWSKPAMVIGMFLVIELLSNNVMEPLLYGSGTGVSPMAVLLSAVFWTWLWGVPGLVLATPMTVCVVVLGKHFPRMKWLAVLFGDEPGLPLHFRMYQRLLAGDYDEVFDLSRRYLKDHARRELYDEILIPALSLAEANRHEGALDEKREQAVFTAMRELIEELEDLPDAEQSETDKGESDSDEGSSEQRQPGADSDDLSRPLILIVAAHDRADAIAAHMLAHLLRDERQRVEVLESGGLAAEACDHAAKIEPAVICVSAMPPMAVSHARYMCKRLHDRLPGMRLMVGVWHATDLERATRRLRAIGSEIVVRDFKTAIQSLRT